MRLLATLISFFILRTPTDVFPPIDIPVDAWAPYWALPDAQSTLGTTGGRMLRQVSPFWYSTHDATTITPDGNLSLDATAAFVAAIRAAGAKVVPSISDGMDAGKMAALLGRPDGGFIPKWYGDPVGAGHRQEAIEAMCEEFMRISGRVSG